MIKRLGLVVVDLGRDTSGDASGLNARHQRSKKNAKSDLPGPTGERKEYTDEEGKVVKVVEWFGYKFHLLVDPPSAEGGPGVPDHFDEGGRQ
jgi:hypothetical protein